MQVQVDTSQIAALESQINLQVRWLRALAIKHGDSNGILRITGADLNRAEQYDFEVKSLKKSVQLIAQPRKEEEE